MPRVLAGRAFCAGGGVGEISLHALQIGADFRRVLIAEVAIFFERLGEDVFEAEGKVGIQAGRRKGLAVQDAIENDAAGFAAEGQGSRRHFIEHHPEGKKIRARVQFLGPDLLGGHVGHGAKHGAGAGEMVLRDFQSWGSICGRRLLLERELGEAEIEKLGVAVEFDEDVGRLDVAMNHALGVRGGKGVGDLDGEGEQDFDLQGLSGDAVLEGHAFEKFHGDEGLIVVLADLVDRADVGVVQRRSGTGLAAETFERMRIAGNVSRKEFEGDKAAQADVFGLVDYAHASAAEFLDDAVVRDGLADHGPGRMLRRESGRVNET